MTLCYSFRTMSEQKTAGPTKWRKMTPVKRLSFPGVAGKRPRAAMLRLFKAGKIKAIDEGSCGKTVHKIVRL